MQPVFVLAACAARVDATVLITGESGVGKEWLARWVHRNSLRGSREFVAVNCGAFAEGLLESELFGHARGAFTGATMDRVGLFEAAHGCTLFLDEIGDMSPAVQVRLLRVLQEREIRRLGENRTRRIDTRVIAATNRNLTDDVRRGRFREDLFYRLRVVEIRIPALRHRPEDLESLAGELLTETALRLGRSITEYTPRALDCLLTHSWPGNIRELQHAIEYACIVASRSVIEFGDLPESVRNELDTIRHTDTLALAERERLYVRAVVDRHGGDRRLAAAELGVSLSTVKRRLRGPGPI